ncbi:DUF2894 domain-containing protein [Luteimonas qiangzhengi]|uniref:DUF2894 domain-containing protein n=1 Tax=Luteimonas sp. MJ146 TaxID=3129240 RepID=UPI0031BA9ABE
MAEQGSSLTGLVAQMGEHARQRNDALAALGLPVGEYPALPAVEDFRRLWATQRQQAQLRASMQPPPADAGPLNSASLAHRALAAMHDSSPGYLQHFMTWLDALAWLDRLQASGGLTPAGDKPARHAAKPPTRKRKGSRA